MKGHLLICHGMVDVNVHFEDAVRLTQRLMNWGKTIGSLLFTRWKTMDLWSRAAGRLEYKEY
ncbi:MAG: hypothetical protein WDN75_01820 [Bacteroidota bacterium]